MSTMIQAVVLPSECNQTAGGPEVFVNPQPQWLAVGYQLHAIQA